MNIGKYFVFASPVATFLLLRRKRYRTANTKGPIERNFRVITRSDAEFVKARARGYALPSIAAVIGTVAGDKNRQPSTAI